MSSDNSTTESQNRRANIQAFLLANAHLLELKKKAYKHIVATELDPGQLITRALAMNGTEAYLNATPAQMSSIVPQLRLFLVQGGGKQDVEIHFHGKTTVDMYDRGTTDYLSQARPTTTNIFREQSENIAAGLKNFSISINDRYGLRAITGKMQLFFRSPGDLIYGPYREFIEIIKRGGGSIDSDEKEAAKIQDLKNKIKATEAFLKDRDNKNKNVKPFTTKEPAPPSLKAVLGWSTPNQSESSPNTPKDPKSREFYEFLRTNRVTFILNVSKHTMSFGEQGELTLDIDLNGHVDDVGGASEEADIFKNTYQISGQTRGGKVFNSQKLKLTNRPIKTRVSSQALFGTNNLEEIKQKLNDMPKSTYFDKLRKQADKKAKALAGVKTGTIIKFEVDFEALLAERSLAESRKKLAEIQAEGAKKGSVAGDRLAEADKHFRLVSEIYARCKADLIRIKHKNFFEALEADGKIKSVAIDKKLLGFVEANSDGTSYSPQTLEKLDSSITPANSRAVNARIKDRFEAQDRGDAKSIKDEENNPFLIGYDKNNKSTKENIFFVRLGDIIDVAFHNTDLAVMNRKGKTSFRLVFDSISLPAGTKEKLYCLADIPIYLNIFNAFFYNKIIRPQVKTMTLSDFCEKLLEYIGVIVTESLSNSKVVQKFVTNLVPVAKASKWANFSPSVRYKSFNSGATTAAYVNDQIANAEDFNKLIFVTMRGVKPNSVSERKRDQELGIYHLVVGASNGPLTKISFSEQNNPYIRTMNVVEGSSQFPIVPQNANVTLMGCPMFYQSQTVYIDADFALKGAARDLGLGGYYAITSVDHNFDGSNFSTELKCYWQSYAITGRPNRKKEKR